MPFNKGDFTQQGVAGHVNANLRLNEKRLVNIDLTSNEEAEGCTIAGTVTDLLNDKVYNVGSAPSGNIEITENTAEPLNIAQYATATVNVQTGVPLENMQVTLLDNVTFTASEADGQYFATFDLPNCRGIPLGGASTVRVKLGSAEFVEYPCTMDLSTGDFTIGDPSLIETPLSIMGNMSDGYCTIYIGDTNTHTITVKFSITGVPTVFACNGGDRIALRSDNYLFVMSCEELTPGRTTDKTYPVPISAIGDNKPRLYSWSVSGGPK